MRFPFDSDPRLQFHVNAVEELAREKSASVSETVSVREQNLTARQRFLKFSASILLLLANGVHDARKESVNMKRRFILFLRGSTFYVEDTVSKKQTSLSTKDRATAERLIHAKNEAEQQPAVNLQIARAYLAASDPQIATRSWQFVMDGALVGCAAATFLARARGASFSFRDRCVIITGGSRGLGLVLARQLAAEGARIALLSRDKAELDRAGDELTHRLVVGLPAKFAVLLNE